MINLPATTDKLELVTSSTADIDVVVSMLEADLTTGEIASAADFTPVSQVTAIVTATTTTIATAPASNKSRRPQFISIRNKHATSLNTVTVQLDNGTIDVTLQKVTLLAGETLVYADGAWSHYDANGAVYTQPGASMILGALASDQSNSTTTPTEITGLSRALAVGKYYFRYLILYQSSATGTGVRFSVNFSGTVTACVYNRMIVGAATAATDAAADQDVVTAAGGIISVMAARAASTAGLGTSISVDTANSDMLEVIEGMLIVTAAGSIQLWHGSETAAATTVKAGTLLLVAQALS